jgi:hypothetical protein
MALADAETARRIAQEFGIEQENTL